MGEFKSNCRALFGQGGTKGVPETRGKAHRDGRRKGVGPKTHVAG